MTRSSSHCNRCGVADLRIEGGAEAVRVACECEAAPGAGQQTGAKTLNQRMATGLVLFPHPDPPTAALRRRRRKLAEAFKESEGFTVTRYADRCCEAGAL